LSIVINRLRDEENVILVYHGTYTVELFD